MLVFGSPLADLPLAGMGNCKDRSGHYRLDPVGFYFISNISQPADVMCLGFYFWTRVFYYKEGSEELCNSGITGYKSLGAGFFCSPSGSAAFPVGIGNGGIGTME